MVSGTALYLRLGCGLFGANCAVQPDVCIIELGGTLGDIESMPFVEALRQLQGR